MCVCWGWEEGHSLPCASPGMLQRYEQSSVHTKPHIAAAVASVPAWPGCCWQSMSFLLQPLGCATTSTAGLLAWGQRSHCTCGSGLGMPDSCHLSSSCPCLHKPCASSGTPPWCRAAEHQELCYCQEVAVPVPSSSALAAGPQH